MPSGAWAASITLQLFFVGNAEPVNAGVNGPDGLSPCASGEKHVLAWQLLLGSSEQHQALSVLRRATYTRTCA